MNRIKADKEPTHHHLQSSFSVRQTQTNCPFPSKSLGLPNRSLCLLGIQKDPSGCRTETLISEKYLMWIQMMLSEWKQLEAATVSAPTWAEPMYWLSTHQRPVQTQLSVAFICPRITIKHWCSLVWGISTRGNFCILPKPHQAMLDTHIWQLFNNLAGSSLGVLSWKKKIHY